VVQPDEVGEAMRRGVELIHPHDRPIPGQDVYTNYGPPLNQSGHGSRRGSQMATYPIDEGYVPEYHTGRRYSTQDQVPAATNSRRSSRGPSQPSQDEQMRRSMSMASQQEVPRYQNEESSYGSQSSDMNGRRVSEANYSAPSRYDRSNNETYTLETERNVVARHYEQTYDQVNHQIDSARQLVEIRKQSQESPERSYPRRPKNRNSNILSAVLCLIKELDGPSLEVAEMAVRCRMEELED